MNSPEPNCAVATDVTIAGQSFKFAQEPACMPGTAYATATSFTPSVSGAGVNFSGLYEVAGTFDHTLVGRLSSPFYVEP